MNCTCTLQAIEGKRLCKRVKVHVSPAGCGDQPPFKNLFGGVGKLSKGS